MDNAKQSFEAGKATGKNQEKGSQLMENATNVAISAKDSALGAGKVVQEKAQVAVDYVKGAAEKK